MQWTHAEFQNSNQWLMLAWGSYCRSWVKSAGNSAETHEQSTGSHAWVVESKHEPALHPSSWAKRAQRCSGRQRGRNLQHPSPAGDSRAAGLSCSAQGSPDTIPGGGERGTSLSIPVTSSSSHTAGNYLGWDHQLGKQEKEMGTWWPAATSAPHSSYVPKPVMAFENLEVSKSGHAGGVILKHALKIYKDVFKTRVLSKWDLDGSSYIKSLPKL